MSEANPLDRVLDLASVPELADLHPDDLASLAERSEDEQLHPRSLGRADRVRFLLSGRIATAGSERPIEAPALVGAVETLANEGTVVRALGDDTRLLTLDRESLRWVMADVFEVWLAVLRHTARRLYAAEPFEVEPGVGTPTPLPASPASLAARILLLSRSEILRELSVYTRGRLASEMEELALAPGSVLWEPETAPTDVFVLVEGSLAIPGEGATSGVDAPGAVLGLRGTLADRARTTRLQTASEARVLRLSAEALIDELEDDPEMAILLLETLARHALRAEAATATGRA